MYVISRVKIQHASYIIFLLTP